MNSQCGKNAECVYSPLLEESTCECNEGWVGNGYTCKDVNECSTEEAEKCHEFAECINIDGAFKCQCKEGWNGDGYDCTSINICFRSSDNTGCDDNADCLPHPAGLLVNICQCRDGWVGNGKLCDNVNECGPHVSNKCHVQADCVKTEDVHKCVCKDGWVGDGHECTNPNECDPDSSGQCDDNATCDFVGGPFVGFTGGAFKCICNPGWHGDGFECNVIDKCHLMKCPENSECIDNTCICKDGFEDVGSGCQPTGNCGTKKCHMYANCIYDEEYNCECKPGYKGDGEDTCNNVNECSENQHECDVNATCTDTDGSYKCACNLGWTGNGYLCNKDVTCDPVLAGQCHENAKCVFNGYLRQHYCKCNQGFVGNGYTCKDINECGKKHSNKCHKDAKCINTPGGYECECLPGLVGDGKKCTSTSKCSNDPLNPNNHPKCDKNAECKNVLCPADSPTCLAIDMKCVCYSGWIGNGYECQNANQCGPDVGDKCHTHAECIKKDGIHRCACKDGFIGDGLTCTTPNECHPNIKALNNGCGVNAHCDFTKDSYQCLCDPGFIGDGRQCKPSQPSCGGITCPPDAYCSQNKCICRLSSHTLVDGICKPIGICKLLNCPENSSCSEESGCVCNSGYEFSEASDRKRKRRLSVVQETRICVDIDECANNSNNCDENATCTNTIGSYTCECKNGWTGNGHYCTEEGKSEDCPCPSEECWTWNKADGTCEFKEQCAEVDCDALDMNVKFVEAVFGKDNFEITPRPQITPGIDNREMSLSCKLGECGMTHRLAPAQMTPESDPIDMSVKN